jgi:hypothetical protein
MDNESIATLHFKHDIGRRIVKARHDLNRIVPVTDDKGWNKQLGMLTEKLEKELDYKASTLNYCFRFASFYPSWDDFAKIEFNPVRGGSNRLETPPVVVMGKDLYWTEVIHQLEGRNGTEDEGNGSADRLAKPKPAKPSKTFWDYLVSLSVDVRDKFTRIAEQRGKHPEELVADIIQDFVKKHST